MSAAMAPKAPTGATHRIQDMILKTTFCSSSNA
jgi:hypothetical protein